MSFLSNQLAVIAERNQVRQTDIVSATGFPASHISRIFSGKQVFVSDEDLDQILAAVARTPEERAKIVRARLQDAYRGKNTDAVKIVLRGGAGKSEKPSLPGELDPEIKRGLEFLAGLVLSNPSVGEAILGLARMMGMPKG